MERLGMKKRFALIVAAVLGTALTVTALGDSAPGVALSRDTALRGVIPFTTADVSRTNEHTFKITWAAAGAAAVAIYAGTSAHDVGRTRLIARGAAAGTIAVTNLPEADRWYFELVPDRGASLVVADRNLHLATAPNFRDIGGYRTDDGRWVRTGLLYRSDQLDRLSDADLTRITHLNPVLIVDLRTDRERQRGADRRPSAASHLIADVYADADQTLSGDPLAQIATPDDAVALLLAANRRFVSLQSARHAYGLLFTSIKEAPGPVVYHCTAGKDRTGWATAVLLTVLGVPRTVVMQDYLASNRYLVEKNRERVARMAVDAADRLEPIFWVREAYLDAAFHEVETRYGSFERYVHDGLGLDEASVRALRTRYLAGEPDIT
jgi:protein-tyrosine phosphatase